MINRGGEIVPTLAKLYPPGYFLENEWWSRHSGHVIFIYALEDAQIIILSIKTWFATKIHSSDAQNKIFLKSGEVVPWYVR